MDSWKAAYAVINTALGIISTAGSTPLINLIPWVSTIAAASSAIQAGLNLAINVTPYVAAISGTFSGGALPTEAERVVLRAKIAELEAIVDAPLPPKEEGEDD